MMLELPPFLSGEAEQQTAQLRDYLIRVAQTLNEEEPAAGVEPADTAGLKQEVSRLQARIKKQVKLYADTTAGWDAQRSLIAEKNAIYIYTDHGTASGTDGGQEGSTAVPGVKIGDGTSFLIDMPFVADDIAAALSLHMGDAGTHVSAEERRFWNNKVTAYLDGYDPETLVLSKVQE